MMSLAAMLAWSCGGRWVMSARSSFVGANAFCFPRGVMALGIQ
jgi:hypothetical protein